MKAESTLRNKERFKGKRVRDEEPRKGRGVFREFVKVDFLLHHFLHARLRGQVNLKEINTEEQAKAPPSSGPHLSLCCKKDQQQVVSTAENNV